MKNRERERERPGPWLWDWCGPIDQWASYLLPGSSLPTFFFAVSGFGSSDFSLYRPSWERVCVCLRERDREWRVFYFPFFSLPTTFYRKVKESGFFWDEIDGSDVLGGIHPTDSLYSPSFFCFWAWVVFQLFTLLGFRTKILSPSLVSPNEAWVST